MIHQSFNYLLEHDSKFIRERKHKLEMLQVQYAIKTYQTCKEVEKKNDCDKKKETHTIDRDQEVIQILELVPKDFQIAIINKLNKLPWKWAK